MDTLVSLFGALARGVRWTFDLAGMAVGVAPATVSISDAATIPSDPQSGPDMAFKGHALDEQFEMSRAEREYLGLWN